jgi:hypothetical protein
LQLEPYFSRIPYTKAQKRRWFHDREGVLFGFAVGFYVFLKIPLLGVLIYGIAEASTAYLITKITDPPPPPPKMAGTGISGIKGGVELEQWAEGQVKWSNKHEFLKLPLGLIDAHNEAQAAPASEGARERVLEGKKFS